MRFNLFSAAVLFSALFVSCKKDENKPMTPPENKAESTITFENVVKPMKYVQSGTFHGEGVFREGGKEIKNLILPSDDPKTNSASFSFYAGKGQRLMFAMMFGASKDWFFASVQPGIELYDAQGNPRTGDISSDVSLWDNGTKNDMSGAQEDKTITSLKARTMPQNLMKLFLSYEPISSRFTLKITNTSKDKMSTDGMSLTTPFAPGVWVVSNVLGGKLLDEKPFFEAQKKSSKELTLLAQTGDPNPLYQKVKKETGIITGLSPAVVVLYTGDKNPLYEMGKKDAGLGLKELSQKGDFSKLQASLKGMKGVKEVYIAGNAPIAPNGKAMTKIKKSQGDKIAYAFMFGYSNDWFYANSDPILSASKGDLTNKTALFDSGTGVDQFPGAGNKQALFGGTPDKEEKPITKVGTTFPVPATGQVVRVTLQ